MDSKLIIKNLEAVFNEHNNLVTIIANINNNLHYTADIRNIADKWYAVFSDITKYDENLNSSLTYLIEEEIWKSIEIEMVKYQQDHYIWVEVILPIDKYKKLIQ